MAAGHKVTTVTFYKQSGNNMRLVAEIGMEDNNNGTIKYIILIMFNIYLTIFEFGNI